MNSCIITALVGMLFWTTACLSDDPADPTAGSQEGVTESTIVGPIEPGDYYYTCSDDPLVCRPGYGAVEWILYPECEPYASHRVKCEYGAIDP